MKCIEFWIFNVKQIMLLLDDYADNIIFRIPWIQYSKQNSMHGQICNIYYVQISLLRIIYTELYAKNMHRLLWIYYYK